MFMPKKVQKTTPLLLSYIKIRCDGIDFSHGLPWSPTSFPYASFVVQPSRFAQHIKIGLLLDLPVTAIMPYKTRPYLRAIRFGSSGDKIWFLCPEDLVLQARRFGCVFSHIQPR